MMHKLIRKFVTGHVHPICLQCVHLCLPSTLQYDVNAINEAQCVLITPVVPSSP
jgi:hypothetical protein